MRNTFFLLLLFKIWMLKSEKKMPDSFVGMHVLCVHKQVPMSHCPLQCMQKIIIYFANKYAELNLHCPVFRSQCSLFVWGLVLFLSFHLVIFCVTLVACAIDTARPHCTLLHITNVVKLWYRHSFCSNVDVEFTMRNGLCHARGTNGL